jgi:geranyl-CoA carboxylase alpha subunit
MASNGDQLYILRQGVTFSVHDLAMSAPASAAASSSDGRLRAAMNGRVVAVLVKQGERVTAGQPVVTLEAMKMEHIHAAPIFRYGFCHTRRRRRTSDDRHDYR